jgi:hypothetical protein
MPGFLLTSFDCRINVLIVSVQPTHHYITQQYKWICVHADTNRVLCEFYMTQIMLVKAKAKLSLCLTKHHTMKTYCGSGGIAPCILNLGTKWR